VNGLSKFNLMEVERGTNCHPDPLIDCYFFVVLLRVVLVEFLHDDLSIVVFVIVFRTKRGKLIWIVELMLEN